MLSCGIRATFCMVSPYDSSGKECVYLAGDEYLLDCVLLIGLIGIVHFPTIDREYVLVPLVVGACDNFPRMRLDKNSEEHNEYILVIEKIIRHTSSLLHSRELYSLTFIPHLSQLECLGLTLRHRVHRNGTGAHFYPGLSSQ